MVDIDMTLAKPIERTDLAEATYSRIRGMILVGDLAPGGKVDPDLLASSFRVSRSTVANALQRLAREELVRIVPQRGTFVRAFTQEEIREVYDVRLCIELWAARKSVCSTTESQVARMRELLDEFLPLFGSANRADLAAFAIQNSVFHTYLVSLAGNKKLLDAYKALQIEFLGYRIYRIREAGKTWEGARVGLPPALTDHEEHLSIVQAYAARDLAQAEKCITNHLTRALENVIQAAAVQAEAAIAMR